LSNLDRKRTSRGAFSSLFFALTCLGLLMIGSLGIDISHAFYARGQLQNAADNAALTGAFYLCLPAPPPYNLQKSGEYAKQMAARNIADGKIVVDDGEDTMIRVEHELKPGFGPHLCHITITRNVSTSLARLVGVKTLPVTVSSSAGAFMTSKSIMSNWMTNLAVSYRAQSGTLNIDTKDPKNNGWIINEWKGSSSPPVHFGVTNVSAGPGDLSNFQTGTVYNVAIVRGGDDGQKQPTTSEIIGSTAIIIKNMQGPKGATIIFVPGSLTKGHPGVWPVPGKVNSHDLQFAKFNAQWRVALVH
jgi:Putative Flp pilus-assembly TadE/G-like